jgi:hypothetical protein
MFCKIISETERLDYLAFMDHKFELLLTVMYLGILGWSKQKWDKREGFPLSSFTTTKNSSFMNFHNKHDMAFLHAAPHVLEDIMAVKPTPPHPILLANFQ